MIQIKTLFLIAIFSICYSSLKGQEESKEPTEASPLSGSLQANGSFFMRDSAIGAFNIPQYDRQLVGSDSWLSINYNKAGYEIGVRFDIFNNSQLQNPKASYTAAGLGRWYLKKKIDKLGVYVGYIYDQIGTGIIFRSYEERALGVDNALLGVQLSYDLGENWRVKGFSGRHKQQFDLYKAHTTGFNTEGYIEKGQLSLAPGFGVLHRNLDDETVGNIVNTIATYAKADSIGATFNTYAATLYNTLNFAKWTLYTEAAYKTPEVMFSPFAEKINRDGTISEGKFTNQAGWIFYANLGFSVEKTDDNWGIGVVLEGKRTEGFNFRTTPLATLNRGFVNYLPPMSRQNTYRLTSRYVPATQELGEQALQLDLKLSPSDKWQIDVNASNILTLSNQQLYRELYLSFLRKNEHAQITFGVQHQNYNQAVYEVKPLVENVQTITIFTEFLKNISETKTLRVEAQSMTTQQDYGSWFFGLVEYSIASKWIFTVSDMWNWQPKKTSALHYPSVSAVFSHGASRFSLAFVKQVEGVICTGGICRLEPAFSGIKLGVNTAF